ncbi:hypothetical protein [Microbacterium jiangjiandongii]|uniref:hypothetical protein n=1 Tax=Microbacterium jiangjiandongii TaxID=3049071 RepID=UPI00214B6004|nr:hypothetical protein [Microbacterium sp. zg.Y843]MCR2814253.1 hypothetical protein [Microbacterium sp. zg.Y843]
MQILLALIAGVALGLAAHFTVGGRDTRGAAVGPLLGAVVGGLVWMALTWAGVGIESPWIWVASFAAPLVVFPALVALTRVRLRHDARERARLKLA